MIPETEDTIAAIATPPGRAALGIVRISGKGCYELLPKIFEPAARKEIVSFRPILGRIIFGERRFIDEAVLTYFEKPHSYTREDLAEITCHGNPLVLERVMSSIVSFGARHARPGEFTYRAFLNGRLDLVQAEAVRDLISADSIYQAELALNQLEGRLSNRLQTLRSRFIELISLLEGNIDFSEEQHYDFIDREGALRRVEEILQEVRGLLGTFDRGRVIKEGFNVALVGKPNVGKSSVFNSLLGRDRAIVTAIPGTTRDYLGERVTVGNHLLNLLDTAGIRESGEIVESEGIRRSREVISKADLILFVLDGSCALSGEDFDLAAETSAKERVVICNKSDLPGFSSHSISGETAFVVSAVTGQGLDRLMKEIHRRADERIRYCMDTTLISSMRHRDILGQVADALERGRAGICGGLSEELPLTDLHEALRLVAEITGEVTIEDIYQQIFNTFCIGK